MEDVVMITDAQDIERYIKLHIPFIIKGYKDEFGPCILEWYPSTLRELLKDVRVSVHVSSESNLNFVHRNFNYEYMSISEFFSRIEASQSKNTPEYLYYRSLGTRPRKDPSTLASVHPYLDQTFKIPKTIQDIIDKYYDIHSSVFRIAQTGVELWTHYDALDNLLVQVIGNKEILLFPPKDLYKLRITDTSSPIKNICKLKNDIDSLLIYTNAYIAMLVPGDILFIPATWSHAVTSLDDGEDYKIPKTCISVNMFMNDKSINYGIKNVYGNEDPLPMKQACDLVNGTITKLSQALPLYFKQAFWSKIAAIALGKLQENCDGSENPC